MERGYWQVTLVCHVHKQSWQLTLLQNQTNYNQEKVQVQINICHITFYCHSFAQLESNFIKHDHPRIFKSRRPSIWTKSKNHNSKFWFDIIDILVLIYILDQFKQLVADKGIVIGPWKAFQKRHDQKVQSFWYFRLAQDKILTPEFWVKVQTFDHKSHFSTI